MLEKIIPNNISVHIASPEMWESRIYDAEYELVRHSVEKRQREFIAGRASAREALKKIGICNFPILHNKRRPIWPEHIVGSISHTEGFCAAMVSTKNLYQGIGVDVEKNDPLSIKLLSYILTPEETDTYHLFHTDINIIGKIIFSIKESLFKAYHPLCNQFFGFHDAHVLLPHLLKSTSLKANQCYSFSATINIPSQTHALKPIIINGHFILDDRYIYSCALIPNHPRHGIYDDFSTNSMSTP